MNNVIIVKKKTLKYTITRTVGAYGPLVLVTAEGLGALRAPCQVCVFFNFFILLV